MSNVFFLFVKCPPSSAVPKFDGGILPLVVFIFRVLCGGETEVLIFSLFCVEFGMLFRLNYTSFPASKSVFIVQLVKTLLNYLCSLYFFSV